MTPKRRPKNPRPKRGQYYLVIDPRSHKTLGHAIHITSVSPLITAQPMVFYQSLEYPSDDRDWLYEVSLTDSTRFRLTDERTARLVAAIHKGRLQKGAEELPH